jgi:hypothetical protein
MSGAGTSRRALLGAAVGLPLLPVKEAVAARALTPLHHAAHGPPPPSGEDLWGRAVAAYEEAAGEVRAFERSFDGRSRQARPAQDDRDSRGKSFEEIAELEERYGELGGVMHSRLRRLLKHPAPDVAALAVKLDLVVEYEVGTLEGGEACFAAIRRDAHRLATMGLSAS